MMESVLVVKGLSTGYISGKQKIAVSENMDASLPAGKLTCLLGRNGSGKSTLLKTLAGFIPPLAGSVMINGRDLCDYSQGELSTRLGVVLTERIEAPNMTVAELTALGRSPYTGFWGRLSAADRAAVDEAIALVGISSLRDRAVATLSDGERQKAMIAKAIAQDTQVIILDEPTAFLDWPSKVETMQLLKRLSRERGLTVFISTHDLEIALRTADNIWFLDRGKPLREGPEAEAALRQAFGI